MGVLWLALTTAWGMGGCVWRAYPEGAVARVRVNVTLMNPSHETICLHGSQTYVVFTDTNVRGPR